MSARKSSVAIRILCSLILLSLFIASAVAIRGAIEKSKTENKSVYGSLHMKIYKDNQMLKKTDSYK